MSQKSNNISNNNKTSKVQIFTVLDSKIQNLLREAAEVRNNSHCPYSNFKVGSAVLCEDETYYTGCNIENMAYPVGICAEKCAVGKAISVGKKRFKAIAVVGDQNEAFTTPCGSCRQFLSEFGDMDVYISHPALDKVLVVSLHDLLPYQFDIHLQ